MTKKALLITVGSRGDAEPFCSLAQSLSAEGFGVDLFLQSDLTQLADAKENITVHELPFTQMDFYKFVGNPSHGKDHPNPRVAFIGVIADIIGELVLPCFDKVANEVIDSSQTNIIVASSLSRALALAIGQAFDIPVCIVNLQPLTPTNQFPHYSDTKGFLQAIVDGKTDEAYRQTYSELEKFQFEFLKEHVDKLYQSSDKLKDKEGISFETFMEMLEGKNHAVLVANAYENNMIPQCTDVGEQVIHTGALADTFLPASGVRPETEAAVASFLKQIDKEKPVCIGFGSMPVGKAPNVVDALKELGMPAIFVGDAFKPFLDDKELPNVLCISSAPYPWLLPKCSIMVCHGGAGTLHSTIRAGIPIVICPFLGDQFAHAPLVESLGIGVQGCANLADIETHELVEAIQKAGSNTRKEASARLGENIRAKRSGVEVLTSELMQRGYLTSD